MALQESVCSWGNTQGTEQHLHFDRIFLTIRQNFGPTSKLPSGEEPWGGSEDKREKTHSHGCEQSGAAGLVIWGKPCCGHGSEPDPKGKACSQTKPKQLGASPSPRAYSIGELCHLSEPQSLHVK